MADDTVAPNAGPWTCFHCGETFTTIGSARDHFGATQDAQPGCLIRVQLGDERGLQMELRKAEAEIAQLRAANERLDYEAGHARAIETEIGRLFKNGARSVQDAFNLFDAMEGRALAAEAGVALRNLAVTSLRNRILGRIDLTSSDIARAAYAFVLERLEPLVSPDAVDPHGASNTGTRSTRA